MLRGYFVRGAAWKYEWGNVEESWKEQRKKGSVPDFYPGNVLECNSSLKSIL